MARKLKVWNGRGYCANASDRDERWKSCKRNDPLHINICAHSREDARKVIEEYCGKLPSVAELRDYFSPCWGNSMNGITPERGLWIEFEMNKPVKVV